MRRMLFGALVVAGSTAALAAPSTAQADTTGPVWPVDCLIRGEEPIATCFETTGPIIDEDDVMGLVFDTAIPVVFGAAGEVLALGGEPVSPVREICRDISSAC